MCKKKCDRCEAELVCHGCQTDQFLKLAQSKRGQQSKRDLPRSEASRMSQIRWKKERARRALEKAMEAKEESE